MKIGDVVVLSSGGPSMTVVAVAEDGSSCNCEWFIRDANICLEMLEDDTVGWRGPLRGAFPTGSLGSLGSLAFLASEES